MNDIDTAAVRADYWNQQGPELEVVLDLRDALDAARAENTKDQARIWEAETRAKAAEARADQLRVFAAKCARGECHDHAPTRAEAAEARIAEIELRLKLTGLPNYWLHCPLWALTGDTE